MEVMAAQPRLCRYKKSVASERGAVAMQDHALYLKPRSSAQVSSV